MEYSHTDLVHENTPLKKISHNLRRGLASLSLITRRRGQPLTPPSIPSTSLWISHFPGKLTSNSPTVNDTYPRKLTHPQITLASLWTVAEHTTVINYRIREYWIRKRKSLRDHLGLTENQSQSNKPSKTFHSQWAMNSFLIHLLHDEGMSTQGVETLIQR